MSDAAYMIPAGLLHCASLVAWQGWWDVMGGRCAHMYTHDPPHATWCTLSSSHHIGISPPFPLQLSRYLEAEIVNHSMLRHPHIVQCREVFLTPDR